MEKGSSSSNSNPSSAEVLRRIQYETQRVKSRLSDNESERSHSSPQKSPNSNNLQQQREQSLRDLIFEEPSLEIKFKDPVSVNEMSSHLKNDLEAFKAKLVDEVFTKDNGDSVPIAKVVMLIWHYRDDPKVVTFMTRFVAEVRRKDLINLTHLLKNFNFLWF